MPTQSTEHEDALQEAREKVQQAQAELDHLKEAEGGNHERAESGEELLRNDSTMAHLLDALRAGKNIGHYGRLVFVMVGRHFLSQEDILAWLTRDPDFAAQDAEAMLHQVVQRDYNPPRRERLLEWQQEQTFPILPHPEDPDCGNFYRNLKFPDSIYKHITEYQVHKNSEEA